MKALSYSTLRNNLAKAMDQVNENHAPIVITRQNGQSAVLLSLEDFESWQETTYLLRSPKMARRLCAAVTQIESGRARIRKLLK